MASFDEDIIEIKGLDKLVRALKVKPPKIKIGVLGSNARSSKSNSSKTPTNAEVGAVHEFGAPARNIKARSFLRMPLSERLGKAMEESGLLDKETLDQVIKQQTLIPWMQKVAIVAEGVVDDAFETSGFGQWPAWKNPNYHNEGGMLLVDTGSLRDSITSEVIS